jgi:hypothetical protein
VTLDVHDIDLHDYKLGSHMFWYTVLKNNFLVKFSLQANITLWPLDTSMAENVDITIKKEEDTDLFFLFAYHCLNVVAILVGTGVSKTETLLERLVRHA